VYCDRRNVQNVHATILETGEQLGRLYAPHKFSHLQLTWTQRAHMNNAGLALKNRENTQSSVSLWFEERKAQRKKRQKRGSSSLPNRTEALRLASMAPAEATFTDVRVPPVEDERPKSSKNISLIAGMPNIIIGKGTSYGS
jgi:hypothetical protein